MLIWVGILHYVTPFFFFQISLPFKINIFHYLHYISMAHIVVQSRKLCMFLKHHYQMHVIVFWTLSGHLLFFDALGMIGIEL